MRPRGPPGLDGCASDHTAWWPAWGCARIWLWGHVRQQSWSQLWVRRWLQASCLLVFLGTARSHGGRAAECWGRAGRRRVGDSEGVCAGGHSGACSDSRWGLTLADVPLRDSAQCGDSGGWGRAPAGASCSACWPPWRPEVAAGAVPGLQRGCVGGTGGASGVPACGRELVGSAGLLRLPCWPWAPSGAAAAFSGRQASEPLRLGYVTAPRSPPCPCLAASVHLPTRCPEHCRQRPLPRFPLLERGTLPAADFPLGVEQRQPAGWDEAA